MIKKVILVFKTHFDIGFTDLAENVIREYAGPMLEQVLETCRSTEKMGDLKYVWTMPSWPLWVVTKECRPELRGQLEHYIENGQIVWHALPFTSHTDFCGEEEYLEGLRYGRELSKHYGKPYPIAAKMTDVPGHGLMLPEILGVSGIRFLHLGCNEFATPPEVPELFYWEAPSGRRVLTMYGKGGYGSNLETPENWKYPVWMSLVHTHDNCGPHSAETIKDLVKEARNMYPDAEIVCGTLDDFCKELENCDLSEVPVYKKDMADTWIHGIGAYPREVREIRESRHRATGMQKLYSQKCVAGNHKKEVDDLWKSYYESMHLFGEHTWGADVKTWLGPERVYEKKKFNKARLQKNYKFMEKSWEEQSQRAKSCESALDVLEGKLESADERNWLYNPLTAPYTGWVQGKTLPKARITSVDIFDKPAFYVESLQPLGSTEIGDCVQKISEQRELCIQTMADHSYVENHRYRLEFLKSEGTIIGVYDKKNKKMILESHGGKGVFSYQYTRHGIQKITEFLRNYGYRFSTWGIQDYGREGYPECKDETYHPAFTAVKIKGSTICFEYEGGVSADLYGDCREAEVGITLPPAGDEIFVSLKLSDKQASPFVESGSFCLPIAGKVQNYHINKPGTVLDPRMDIAECGNHAFYALEEFAAADDGDGGVCVMPLDTPLMSLGEDGIYTYRRTYEEHEETMFFNLFNNMWGTNFPQWQEGNFEYRFIIWGYDRSQAENLLERSVQLAEGIPMTSSPVETWPIKLPEHMQLLNIKEDKDGVVLVTRNLRVEEGRDRVSVPGYKICEVDYYGRKEGQIQENTCEFEKRGYGLHLFKVKHQWSD